mmetsp:Transcript_77844/g.161729  ORF Transcript_77844/g.161729 Transcript_77844/m.161729 type:complete len:855 (-) Transcript_77844:27-2591(-)
MRERLEECLGNDNYCEAIRQQKSLEETLADPKFKDFPALQGLREGLSGHYSAVQQKLSDGLRVAAISADFDAERYQDILNAYSILAPEQALSVGKELIRHVTECIVVVSRQCMLMFSTDNDDGDQSSADWHRKAQIRQLCQKMEPRQFVDCAARLYEHLCDFLYRHQFLCRWHEQRVKEVESEADPSNARLLEVLMDILTELNSSKRNVWHHITQQVSLVLMTLDFQYPSLSEESFLHILNLTQMLIDEGDAFMGAGTSSSSSSTAQGGSQQQQQQQQWRQYSASIRGTLKSKAHDYFQSLHLNAWVGFKVAYIEQDTWQRLPVAKSFNLIRKERLQLSLPRREPVLDGGGPGLRTAENNPFRNYKAEPLSQSNDGQENSLALGDGDEIEEHALLQQWIDDRDISSLPAQQDEASLLSNSNRSPVVSTSVVELAHLLERYFRMMLPLPGLALDIFQASMQLLEFYMYCILCLFLQDSHLQAFFQELDTGSAPSPPGGTMSDAKLQSRQDALFLQQLCPDLRRAMVRARESMSSLSLPDTCATIMGMQAPVSGHVLLQVTAFAKLTSSGSLCALAERCVGFESLLALLANLKEVQETIEVRLPKNAREGAMGSLKQYEVLADQLQTLVLRCAASDVLEVPHVGRVSLDHFSNTMQALRWDARDFSQGSPAAPYIDQLKAQLEELARRIPCAGGGSIRLPTQRMVWRWMEVRILQEFVDIIAKCGRKKSPEALQRLEEDFSCIKNVVQQYSRSSAKTEGGDEESNNLLPSDHALYSTTQWSYLDDYIEAHNELPADVGAWCNAHPNYPLRIHKALIDYLQGSNPKASRQLNADVEAMVARHTQETARRLTTDRRGL